MWNGLLKRLSHICTLSSQTLHKAPKTLASVSEATGDSAFAGLWHICPFLDGNYWKPGTQTSNKSAIIFDSESVLIHALGLCSLIKQMAVSSKNKRLSISSRQRAAWKSNVVSRPHTDSSWISTSFLSAFRHCKRLHVVLFTKKEKMYLLFTDGGRVFR